jgi:hypothetical protein
MTAIAEGLRRADGEVILASGTDFSGRAWVWPSVTVTTHDS